MEEEECPGCSGTGDCQNCDGDDPGCTWCDGTGECLECDGTGKLKED